MRYVFYRNMATAVALLFACTGISAPLSRDQADTFLKRSWQTHCEAKKQEAEAALKQQSLNHKNLVMPFNVSRFGEAPEKGHSLWISMHGGGGTTRQVNDGQWKNQGRLYKLKEGYYVTPRAPTDKWNLWHQKHIDALFDKLIAYYVIAEGVDPGRVYIMGYSAGGDGVYQLAPRMADRLAAAAMMAGHPNETKPDGLRNIGFALYCGGRDSGYKRNEETARWGTLLDELEKADPGGYKHKVRIFPQFSHWMNGADREALPWMAEFTRKSWPKKVVWLQDDVTHKRFYWLAVDSPEKGDRVSASISGQTLSLESRDMTALTLRLHDDLLDLDQPLRVLANGKEVYKGRVLRSKEAITRSLNERSDPQTACFATLRVEWK